LNIALSLMARNCLQEDAQTEGAQATRPEDVCMRWGALDHEQPKRHRLLELALTATPTGVDPYCIEAIMQFILLRNFTWRRRNQA
jgi:hypothetical protein